MYIATQMRWKSLECVLAIEKNGTSYHKYGEFQCDLGPGIPISYTILNGCHCHTFQGQPSLVALKSHHISTRLDQKEPLLNEHIL